MGTGWGSGRFGASMIVERCGVRRNGLRHKRSVSNLLRDDYSEAGGYPETRAR